MLFNSFENYPMSWKPVLKKGKGSLCRNLAIQLEQDIAKGKLLPGTKLPPQRELADYLDINLSTVSRAFKICSEKGLLTGNVGRGTYVAYDAGTRIAVDVTDNQVSMIELGIMMPETVQQEELSELLKEILQERDYGCYFQYSIHVDEWQKMAAVSLLRQVGCITKPDAICFSTGAQNALSAILAGIFQTGDYIGTDPLVYPGLKSIASMLGIRLIPIRQCNNEMSEEGIRYAVKNHRIKALYVMPDSQNPTTHIMSESCRDMIAKLAEEYNLLVIEDSIDRIIQLERKRLIFSRIPERTIFIMSLSKAINPALRLAYSAVPEKYLSSMKNALYNLNLSLSSLLLEIASRLIVSDKIWELLEHRRKGINARNELTDKILKDYCVAGNKYSLSRWLTLPQNLQGKDFELLAEQRGVFVYGSERFAVGKDNPGNAARLAICSPIDIDKLELGLLILKEILDGISC